MLVSSSPRHANGGVENEVDFALTVRQVFFMRVRADPLPESDRDRLAKYLAAVGELRVLATTGLHRNTFYAALGGRPVYRSTHAAVARGLHEWHSADPVVVAEATRLLARSRQRDRARQRTDGRTP